MKNFATNIYWNFINAGKDRFYVEDPRIPFINGFSLIFLLVLIPFGIQRLVTEGSAAIAPAVANFIVALVAIVNLIVLRRTFRSDWASSIVALCVVSIAGYVFYEGATGGDTGILWVYPIPTLIFFLSGKRSALGWSMFLVALVIGIISLHILGYIVLPYTATQLVVFLFPLFVIISGLYVYANFTELNAQELAERTKSLKEGFEIEKKHIKEEDKQKEEALKEKLDTFFNITDELVGIANLKGEFIDVNPAFLKTFQYTKEEMLGKLFREFIFVDDVAKSIEAKESLKQGKSLVNFITRNVRKDGSMFWLMWNAAVKNGLIYSTARVVDDMVNAQKKTEEKMKEIEELNRLMVGREVRMAELKEEIETLKGRSEADRNKHL